MHTSPQSSFGREVEPSCVACRHHTLFRRRDIQEGLQNGQGCTLLSEDELCSSPPRSHPWPSFLTRAYGTLLTSLFFSSPNASMLAHVALPSCQTEGGYWAEERGLLSTAQVQCGKNGEFDGGFCLIISIYIYCYCVIQLYTYIPILLLRCLSIVLFVYFSIAYLKHGSIAFFISIVLIRYSIFRNCPFFRLLIITRIAVVAVFLSFIELSYYLFLISWQRLPVYALSYLYP